MVMESPRKHKFSDAVKEEVKSEDGNVKDLLVKRRILKNQLVKRRRIEVSWSSAQLQHQIEVSDMENKAPDGCLVEDSSCKDLINMLSSCAVHSNGEANGHSNELASSKLLKICKTHGWKEPWYDFEDEGPLHIRIFKCKVTVHLDGLVNTIVECFSDPKPNKKAAEEHAAQGALWFLQNYGYV